MTRIAHKSTQLNSTTTRAPPLSSTTPTDQQITKMDDFSDNFGEPDLDIEAEIGSGAFGTVYRIRDLETFGVVAMKRTPTDRTCLRSLNEEIETWKRLIHVSPNSQYTIKVISFFETLADRRAERRTLFHSLGTAKEISTPICSCR